MCTTILTKRIILGNTSADVQNMRKYLSDLFFAIFASFLK